MFDIIAGAIVTFTTIIWIAPKLGNYNVAKMEEIANRATKATSAEGKPLEPTDADARHQRNLARGFLDLFFLCFIGYLIYRILVIDYNFSLIEFTKKYLPWLQI